MSRIRITIKSSDKPERNGMNDEDELKPAKVIHNLTNISGHHNEDSEIEKVDKLSDEIKDIPTENKEEVRETENEKDSSEEENNKVTFSVGGSAGFRAKNISDVIYGGSKNSQIKDVVNQMQSFAPKFSLKTSKMVIRQPNSSHLGRNNKDSTKKNNTKEEKASPNKEKKNNKTSNSSSNKTSETDKQIAARQKAFQRLSIEPKESDAPKKRKRSLSLKMNSSSNYDISSISTNMMMDTREFLRASDESDAIGGRRSRREKKSQRKILKDLNKKNADYPKKISIFLPILLQELAKKMKRKSSEILKFLISSGEKGFVSSSVMNDDVIVELIGMHFDCEIEIEKENSGTDIFETSIAQDLLSAKESDIINRFPVVALMGHVDHGKTSVLDFYRRLANKDINSIVDSEAGSITQNIGAFKVRSETSEITFIDTPGHAAFSEMRSKGAGIADIAILIVSGTEGVREQTIESINAARANGVPIIVFATKSDLPGFNIEKVYSDIAKHDLVPESWGGDTIVQSVSAYTGEGMEEALNMVSLQAQIQDIKTTLKSPAKGSILLSLKNEKHGTAITVITKIGIIKKGDIIVTPSGYGRVRKINDSFGKPVQSIMPSEPGEIFGIEGLPLSGEEIKVVKSMREAKAIHSACVSAKQITRVAGAPKGNLDIDQILSSLTGTVKQEEEQQNYLNIFVKASTNGTLSAVILLLENLNFKNTKINIIGSGVGSITTSECTVALNVKAVICGFQVGFIDEATKKKAMDSNASVVLSDVIYHISDEISKIAKARTKKKKMLEQRSTLEVIAIFKSSKVGNIAGCRVVSGEIERNHLISIIRNKEVIIENASILSMKHDTQSVKKANSGMECGLVIEGFDKFEMGDSLYSFEELQIEGEV